MLKADQSTTGTDGATEAAIAPVIRRWHQQFRGELPGGLESLIAEDCVFYSPIVFTPQKGKALVLMYLQAAGISFGLGSKDRTDGSANKDGSRSVFRYTREVLDGYHAVLEFESEIDGKYINGIDSITCNDMGQITEFKVLIRPLQAINAVHAQMQQALQNGQT
ncbi:MAG: nuclear transport factor 2 family protein [Gammaproteobacteria bacterium]